jgi:hypothetical protein
VYHHVQLAGWDTVLVIFFWSGVASNRDLPSSWDYRCDHVQPILDIFYNFLVIRP